MTYTLREQRATALIAARDLLSGYPEANTAANVVALARWLYNGADLVICEPSDEEQDLEDDGVGPRLSDLQAAARAVGGRLRVDVEQITPSVPFAMGA